MRPGKQTKVKESSWRSQDVLELVHSDVWGSSPIPSRNGALYFVTFIDDYSRNTWLYLMRHKSQVFEMFKLWKAQVERQRGKKVKCLRTDNGGEYTSKE